MGKKIKKILRVLALAAVLYGIYDLLRYHSEFLDRCGAWCAYEAIKVEQQCTKPLADWYSRRQANQATVVQLVAERNMLLKRVHDMEAQTIELQALVSFADDVKEIAAFRDRCYQQQGRIVRIILKQITPYEHYCYIDSGAQDGVARDMVLVYRNYIVGRVVDVYPRFSKVAFITDKSCNVAAYCFKTQARGIYSGSNSLDKASFNFVSHLENMKEGDMIISSGDGLVYPPGLGLGTVESAVIQGVEYQVVVKPLLNVQELTYAILLQR